MMNKGCKIKRILALVLALATLLGCAPALAESYTAIVKQNGLPVYADAQLSRKIAELESYTLLTVKAVKGDVAQLGYKGYTVYAEKEGLASVEELAIPAKVNQASRVFEEPDLLSRSAALKAGVKLNVLGTSGDWAMIEKDGVLGYTYVKHLTPDTTATLPPQTTPEPTEDPFLPGNGANENPQTGNSNGVTIETFAAAVTVASLPVYKSANAASQKLGSITQGQQVTVYAYNDEWAYIGMDGKYGFCARKGLEKVSAQQPGDAPSADPSKAIPATVTAASVKVYQSPSTSSKTLGTLQNGAEVNVYKTNENWAYIELNGNYGYCALDALTKTSELEPGNNNNNNNGGQVIGDKKPLGTATVVQAAAPLYGSMNANAEPEASLKMGETLSYYGYDSNWVLVGKDGQFGFVPRKYLSADSYAELKAEDTGSAVSEMQNALLSLGYLDAVPSNNFNNLTTEAVKRLQAACGMSQTGIADVGTLRVLYSGNAPASPLLSISIASGEKSDNVTRIQTRLHALGYLSRQSSIDGDFGTTTANAIRLFQKAAGGSATGAADNNTIRALYHASAPTLPAGTEAADANSGNTGGGSSGNTTEIGNGLGSTTSTYYAGMSNAQKLEHVIYVAQQQLGKKYVFGSAGTATFDCSGLTMYCFKKVGVSLRHSAYSEGYNDNHKKISSKSSMRRGDLVFFNTISDGDQCDHVGIYLGNNHFIHASSGAGKVVVSNMSSGYYSRVFSWGRRVLEA